MNRKSTARGFTLLELMVTIAILAILALIAAPSFNNMLINSKIRESLHAWQTSFYYAQQEAIRRKQIIEFCPSDNGTSCIAGSKDFSQGWIVWYQDPSGQPIVLQDVATPDTGINITIAVADGLRGCASSLCFWRNGRLPPNFNGATITLTPTNTSYSSLEKRLTINSAGRLKGE